MRALDDLKYNCTRRHFLSSASLGIGATALASLLDPALLFGQTGKAATAPASAARRCSGDALRPARAARHLSVPERRPVAARSLRSQAAAAQDERTGAAGLRPHGTAADRHDVVPEVAADGRLALRVRAARQVRRVGQRADAAHGEDRRRAVLRQGDVHRGDQPRSGDHVLPDRIAAGRASLDGRVALVRPRLGKPEPSRVHRPALAGARGRSAALFVAVGQRLPAVAASGRAVPPRQGSGAVSRPIPRA